MPPEDSLDLLAGLPPDVMAAAIDALGQPGAAQEEAFAALCRAHPEHAARVRQLGTDLAGVERLLDGGYGGAAAVPAQLGPYRVVRRLGGGAFGEVYLCDQSEPVRREVAVKVLRAGVGDRTTLLRFAAERQLVASLQHPAIAQVFDAGTLSDGRPFFVMAAIDGPPLDRYCDEHVLTVEARIDLFCDLCRGVQHAHERGIVHRDLKPANVLVVTLDGGPRPRVIDFGIAKVLQSSRVVRSFDTEAGRVVGTPGYMSPEQQKGASDDVDARADVWSLGVMLYELLCGQLPWAVGAAATDTDPQRPSTRVSASADAAVAIARDRSTQPRRLAKQLRGDLDWIILKCLQRDRERRYGSVQELIEDLERHRRAEPVHAGPPSTTYKLSKFVRRHRAGTAIAAASAFMALLGAVWVGHYANAAARVQAERGEELAAAKSLFLRGGYSATDHVAMARIAESLAHADADWSSLKHAVSGFDKAIQLAERGGRRDDLPALRRQLADVCERIAREPAVGAAAADPAYPCAVAQAKVRLATLVEPGERADQLLRDGTAALDSVRGGDAPAGWNERLWLEASLQVARADIAKGRLTAAADCLDRLGPALPDRMLMVRAVEVWLACSERAHDARGHDPALHARAIDAAIATLARAVDHGATRESVLALAGIGELQADPRGQELLGRLGR